MSEEEYSEPEATPPSSPKGSESDSDVEPIGGEEVEIIGPTESVSKSKTRKRRSAAYLSPFEVTKIISKRAQELRKNAMPYIIVPSGPNIMVDPLEIAKMELYNFKLPYKIIRKFPNKEIEEWTVNKPGEPGNLKLPRR